MNYFLASLQNELFKLRKRKKYLVFLILGCLICAGSALRLLVVNYLSHGAVSSKVILGSLISANLPFLLLLFLPLIAIMGACDLFAAEQHDHTIRFSLMRPIGKGKLFFSKAAAVFLVCVFDALVLCLVSAVTQMVLGGGTYGLGNGLISLALDLLPLVVLILFFCLVNQLIGSPGLTVLLCLVVYAGLVLLGTYIPPVGGLSFTGYLRWHNLWVGITLPFASLLSRIGLLAGYGLVFGSCGFWLFDRKDA